MKNLPFSAKTFFILTFNFAISANLFSQYNNPDQFSSTKTITIYTSEFQKGKAALNQFLTKLNAEVLNQELSTNSVELRFTALQSQIFSIDSMLGTLGYITSSRQNNNNLKNTIKSLQNQIEDQQILIDRIKLKALKDSTFNQKNNSETQIHYHQDKIKEANRTLNSIQENENRIYINLDLRDEQSVPTGDSKIAWAKMPGLAYNYLSIENPKIGISDKAYSGINLKYIFTKGKSFFQIGVLKSQNLSQSDSTSLTLAPQTFNEFFTVEFGQDFYTKHFGRGNRKFFNLYSGYTIGGMIPNKRNDESMGFVPLLNLSMGVELIKTKHILLDTRASYFLPLDGINRNTRGILMGASFNFVF